MGIEPTILWSRVRHPNYSANRPQCWSFACYWFYKSSWNMSELTKLKTSGIDSYPQLLKLRLCFTCLVILKSDLYFSCCDIRAMANSIYIYRSYHYKSLLYLYHPDPASDLDTNNLGKDKAVNDWSRLLLISTWQLLVTDNTKNITSLEVVPAVVFSLVCRWTKVLTTKSREILRVTAANMYRVVIPMGFA